MSVLHLAPVREEIQRVRVELVVVGFFEDERPLRGMAGRIDWRLCGGLSRLIRASRITGAAGEALLTPGQGGVRAAWVLALGLGPRAGFDLQASGVATALALRRAVALRVRSLALPFPLAGTLSAGDGEGRLRVGVEGLLASLAAAWEQTPDRPESAALALVSAPGDRPALIRALRARAAQTPVGLRLELPEERPGERHHPAGTRTARADS